MTKLWKFWTEEEAEEKGDMPVNPCARCLAGWYADDEEDDRQNVDGPTGKVHIERTTVNEASAWSNTNQILLGGGRPTYCGQRIKVANGN